MDMIATTFDIARSLLRKEYDELARAGEEAHSDAFDLRHDRGRIEPWLRAHHLP